MGERFNASEYLLDRRLEAGDGERLALTGPAGEIAYHGLHEMVCRTAAGLREIGLLPEQRVVVFMADGPEFVATYLAAMRVGAVPVPVSTMLRADGLTELLVDSHARFLATSQEFADVAARAAAMAPELAGVVAGAGADVEVALPVYPLPELVRSDADGSVYPTTPDSPAFWLYTSGTTGTPKAAMHRHGAIQVVCETYGKQVLGVTPDDRCLSAAKSFFAYGLGNSILFPMSAGAASILEPSPSRPETLAARAHEFGATLFFAGPSFFAAMLRASLPEGALRRVRLAVSAGEALPAGLYGRWTTQFGVDVLDGLGMTEMLHIFLSNRVGDVRPGTTGVAVPGYDLRIVDEDGHDVPDGTPGILFVRGRSAATGYWCRYDVSRTVFRGEWLRTGDMYVRDAQGSFRCLGRTDDVLKVGGIWVAPAEVEEALLEHPGVAQAVVVGATDGDGLEKSVAFVVLRPGSAVDEEQLTSHCREVLPAFKRPRRVVFLREYPTTATGKVRRTELRGVAATVLRQEPIPADR